MSDFEITAWPTASITELAGACSLELCGVTTPMDASKDAFERVCVEAKKRGKGVRCHFQRDNESFDLIVWPDETIILDNDSEPGDAGDIVFQPTLSGSPSKDDTVSGTPVATPSTRPRVSVRVLVWPGQMVTIRRLHSPENVQSDHQDVHEIPAPPPLSQLVVLPQSGPAVFSDHTSVTPPRPPAVSDLVHHTIPPKPVLRAVGSYPGED